MPSYEAMLVLKPALKEEEQKTLLAELENILKENQAEIKNKQLFGRRQLAYELNRCTEGIYYLIDFSALAPTVVAKLRHACKINENILRVMIIKGGKANG